MKASIVGPRCFASDKSFFVGDLGCLISLYLRDFVFLNATIREWNIPQERILFSFPVHF